MYVKDRLFEGEPFFEKRQIAYGKVGRTLADLLERAEGVTFADEEKEIFQRIFVVMSVVDYMLDDLHYDKSKLTDFIVHADSDVVSLNNALARLQTLIEKHGDYQSFIESANRALSYSEKDSLQDRHREALYLGKAIAVAVRKEGQERAHLTELLGVLSSLGNFADDVMDHRRDGQNPSWALRRMRAAVREVGKLYGISNNPNTHLFQAAITGLTLYDRRVIPASIRQKIPARAIR
jgi:hypothetical protein